MSEPNYTKPTSQLDLEARQKDDYVPSIQLLKGTDPEPSENGYVGTDEIYQNYANETEKPLQAQEGPEVEIEKNFVTEDADASLAATPEGSESAAEDEEEEEGQAPQTSSFTASSAPFGTPGN